jgi:hypothetical protein
MAHPSRACLDEIARTVPITAAQSAAIISIVANRLDRWITTKNPSIVVVPGLADITLHRDGHLWWYRGCSVERRRLIPTLGELLGTLLRMQETRVPPGLLYIVARATDSRHLAPFESLQEFVAAVERHASDDRTRVLDGLLAYYFMRRSGHPPLDEGATISDVRRLRRAGGVPLRKIATDTGIPLSLLRELEWGVLANWDPSHTARSLQAYAERAGLDAESVAAVVRREFEEQEASVPALVPAVITAAPIERSIVRSTTVPFAIAASVLFCIALAAPPDPSHPAEQFADVQDASPMRPQPAALLAPIQDVEPPPVVADEPPPVSEASPAPVRLRPSTARKPYAPARSRDAVSQLDRAPQVSRRAAPPGGFAKFARAIVGDGRHKVEPFPRVQN